MIPLLFALATASAPALVSPPAPPMPGAADRQRYGDALRRECLSEKGVSIVLDHWVQLRAANAARLPQSHAIEQEIGEAAYSDPVDINRLERAKAAQRADQARFFIDSDADEIAILHQLSPADRLIFARQTTSMRPLTPAKTCPLPSGQ